MSGDQLIHAVRVHSRFTVGTQHTQVFRGPRSAGVNLKARNGHPRSLRRLVFRPLASARKKIAPVIVSDESKECHRWRS